MQPHRFHQTLGSLLVTLILCLATLQPAYACTRAVFKGHDGTVFTGRTMDWKEDIQSNLWVFPRGMQRDGAAGPKSPKWVSKYGSLIASGYDLGSTDGINEKGLVVNLLYLVESDYGSLQGKPPLSISLWGQYVLDNFATVAEAVAALRQEPFRLRSMKLDNGVEVLLHLAISDATGDSAIFQYIHGKLIIHHGPQYQVMTNSPAYDQQLALNEYWVSIGGLTFLPGTNRSADRFARTYFLINAIPTTIAPSYIKAVPQGSFANQAALSVLSVMRSVSVPLGITTPGQPNIASTVWRTVADHTNLVYFFDSATSPNVFWIPMKQLDLKEGAPVRKLVLVGGKVYAGNVANKFEPAPPFAFLPAAAE
ncbi:MAG: linear amide C-N hydrolase [Desulfobaccales bacterium]